MTQMPTQFAPAAVASQAQILEDARKFSEQTFARYLVDTLPDTFLILNEQRQVVMANEAFVKMMNSDPDHVLGKRPGDLFGCEHALEAGENSCGTTEYCRQCGAVRAILKGVAGMSDVQECRIVQEEGDGLNLRVWTRPLAINDRNFVIFAIRDTSNEERRKALERVFFHDILNTAGIVSAYSQLLEMNPEEIYALAPELRSVTQRLVSEIIIQQDLLHAERGDLVADIEPTAPDEIIRQIARQYRNHSLCEGRFIETHTPKNLVIHTDKTLLSRVLGNMVKNAIEAIEEGQVVTIGYDVLDTTIRFFVHNESFMPVPVQLQVFQRSFSTKSSGRGLGTYSMKLLSEKYLKGKIYFKSTQADGTTFFAEYPLN